MWSLVGASEKPTLLVERKIRKKSTIQNQTTMWEEKWMESFRTNDTHLDQVGSGYIGSDEDGRIAQGSCMCTEPSGPWSASWACSRVFFWHWNRWICLFENIVHCLLMLSPINIWIVVPVPNHLAIGLVSSSTVSPTACSSWKEQSERETKTGGGRTQGEWVRGTFCLESMVA